jgi:hypothetical protein
VANSVDDEHGRALEYIYTLKSGHHCWQICGSEFAGWMRWMMHQRIVDGDDS